MCGRIRYTSLVGTNVSSTDREVVVGKPLLFLTLKNENKFQVNKGIWGIKNPFSDKPHSNARVETVTEKTTFRKPFFRNRCIVPAEGFYENGIFFKQEKPSLLAAFYTENKEVCILTQESKGIVKNSYHRMPVILNKETLHLYLSEEPWLNILERINESKVENLLYKSC